MGTILIVEKDPVFGAVLADRLHVAGHQVEHVSDPARALEAAAAASADLAIFALGADGDLETLGALREQGLAIVALADDGTSPQGDSASPPYSPQGDSAPADRMAVLRAGADEYLSRPVDLEELLLRTERLVGSRAFTAPVLEGDLANHPLWELLQYLRQAGKSGDLVLRGKTDGCLRVDCGSIVAARCGELPGAEALVALLGMKVGRFRFATEDDETQGKETIPLERTSIQEVLMQVAWLEDELGKRATHMPVRGAPLTATGLPVPQSAGDFAELPLGEVHRLIATESGIRLHDLLERLPLAPQKIRLAVAYLIEQQILTQPQESANFPTTTEIESSVLMEVMVHEFLRASREAGFDGSSLPFLILVEPGVWSSFLELLRSAPGFQGNKRLQRFAEQLERRQGGSISFDSEIGQLSLHARRLSDQVRAQIEAVVTACAGVLVWLDDGSEADLVETVAERVERGRGAARGTVLAANPEARDRVDAMLASHRRWRLSHHAPQSLLGLLRLLQPSPES